MFGPGLGAANLIHQDQEEDQDYFLRCLLFCFWIGSEEEEENEEEEGGGGGKLEGEEENKV